MGVPYLLCAIVAHPAVNACLELKAANDVNCHEIDRIEIRVNPAATALAYRRNPQDSLEAIVSLYHCAAAAIVSSTFGVKEISTEKVRCPAVIAVRDRIEAVGDSSIAPDAAEVTVSLRTGVTLRHRVEHCVGSSTRPMSDRDLEEKFRSLAKGVMETSKINALLEKCWGLTGLSDVGTITRTATG
jgi:2-methylcitrate dehydratase PrpD